MKLIMCIILDTDRDEVTKGLIEAGYRATVLASSGAYFRRGNNTLLIGVQDHQVDDVIEVIRARTSDPGVAGLKRATLFVLGVERFEQV